MLFANNWHTCPKYPREEQSSEEDTASCSSLSSMSRSSSYSSSSSSDEKMKRKGKGKLRLSKTKNKIKKARKHHKVTDVRKRARGPFEVIRRYKKVLKAYNRGLKLSASCAYAGVNELSQVHGKHCRAGNSVTCRVHKAPR
ncbi:unnamed protein product [Arctogadus glacialis]